jgi:hypothetical protein
LFKNSSDGEEKMNLPMLEELALRTQTRRVARLRRVCNIKDRFKLKLKRRKIQIKFSGSRWNLEKWVFTTHQW